MKKQKNEKKTEEKPNNVTADGAIDVRQDVVEAAEPKETKTEVEKPPLEELQIQLADAKDKYLRLSAEFDNYRKRTLREKMDLTRYASEEVLRDILPVIDDFERAIKSTEVLEEAEPVKEGLKLIYSKFSDVLKSKGVKEIEAIGKVLDTDLHEAVTKIPAPDEQLKGKIVDVILKGYVLNDKVLRFAKVVIGE